MIRWQVLDKFASVYNLQNEPSIQGVWGALFYKDHMHLPIMDAAPANVGITTVTALAE